YRNDKVCILAVNFIDHLLWIGELWVEKFHRVPLVVVAPILPVLDNSIQRNFQFAILFNDFKQFLLAFVALTALPEAIGPQWKHRHLSGQLTHLGYDTIRMAAIHEVVIDKISNFRLKGGFRRAIRKMGR